MAKAEKTPKPSRLQESLKALQIEQRPIGELIPFARNSRTHSEEQVAQIAASMREFGWTNPVLIDEAGGIVAGHGRVMAARMLKVELVPCIVLRGLSESQRRAYVIADNRLALNAGWDTKMLALEMNDLATAGDIDLELTGFTPAEIDNLIDIAAEPLEEMPALADGDREPFQQMTFTLHDDQVEQVKAAIEKANGMGEYVNSPNENGNGNALARVCETFLGAGNGKR